MISYTTDLASEPHCFELAPGDYTVSVKPPADYVATTSGAMTVTQIAGSRTDLAFGVRRGAAILSDQELHISEQFPLIVSTLVVLVGLAGAFTLSFRNR